MAKCKTKKIFDGWNENTNNDKHKQKQITCAQTIATLNTGGGGATTSNLSMRARNELHDKTIPIMTGFNLLCINHINRNEKLNICSTEARFLAQRSQVCKTLRQNYDNAPAANRACNDYETK